MKGQRIHIPLVPYIPSRDPFIWRSELEYMVVHLGPVDKWGFALVSNWARGPTLRQAPFQTPGWVSGSSTGQTSPFSSLAIDDGADGSNTEHFHVTLSEIMILPRLSIVVVSL